MKHSLSKLFLSVAVSMSAIALMSQTPAVAPAPAAAPAPAVAPKVVAPTITWNDLTKALPDVLAEAGTFKVTKAEILDMAKKRNIPADKIAAMPKERQNMLFFQIVNQTLQMKYLAKKAEDAGFKADKTSAVAMVKAELAKVGKDEKDLILKQAQAKTEDEFAEKYTADPEVRLQLAIASFFRSTLETAKTKIADAEIVKFYEAQKDKMFTKPEQVNVAHILLLTIDKATGKPMSAEQIVAVEKKIKEIEAKIKAGEDFGKLAKEFSEDPGSKEKNGELGMFNRGQMVPEFENAAFSLAKPGDVSPIIKTQYGYHILKLIAKAPKSVFPLDDKMKDEIKTWQAEQNLNKTFSEEIGAFLKNVKLFGIVDPSKAVVAPAPAAAPAPVAAPAPAAAPKAAAPAK